MNLHEALKKVNWDFQEYFKYKFPDARFDQSVPTKTEEGLLKVTGKKTMNAFYRWERTGEYKGLVAIYLQSRVANDLYEIYNSVAENAKTGDDKAVKLYLTLSKEINENAKLGASLVGGDSKNDIDDDLVL